MCTANRVRCPSDRRAAHLRKEKNMARFTNQAQLSYNGAVVNSNTAVGEIVEVLTVSKTAVTGNYVRGGDVTYVISAVNSGSTPLTGVSITDDLGGYTFGSGTLYPLTYVDGSARVYVNGVLQTSPPTVVEGPPIAFSGLTVPASGNLILIYEARVNRFAPLGADDSIVNTAAVTATGITAPASASATVTPAASSDLTITKSVDPVSVTENGTVTYTFMIQNYGGEATAADAVSVRDVFNPILSDITVSLNDAALTSPDGYTYDQATGTFVTVPGIITVPAASFVQDTATGAWTVTPGVSRLTVTGTL